MNKGKAAGSDGVPSEMIKALNEIGIKEVTKLLNIIYTIGKTLADMKKSVYIAIPKKNKAVLSVISVECDQHRMISLMSHLTKML